MSYGPCGQLLVPFCILSYYCALFVGRSCPVRAFLFEGARTDPQCTHDRIFACCFGKRLPDYIHGVPCHCSYRAIRLAHLMERQSSGCHIYLRFGPGVHGMPTFYHDVCMALSHALINANKTQHKMCSISLSSNDPPALLYYGVWLLVVFNHDFVPYLSGGTRAVALYDSAALKVS